MNRKRTQDEIDLEPTFASTLPFYTWQKCDPNMRLNFAKMKQLLGILRRTKYQLEQFGETRNIEVKEFIDKHPNLYESIANNVSVGQMNFKGAADAEDVLHTMDLFIEQWNKGDKGKHIDPQILYHLACSFAEYRRPDNKKSLEQIFKLEDSQNTHKDPFTIPTDIKKFGYILIEKGVNKTEASKLTGDMSKDYYVENFDGKKSKGKYAYKWDILQDYLFEKCIVGKAPTAPIPSYRRNIKRYWGIDLPERCEMDYSRITDDWNKDEIKDLLRRLR